jgi:hypothetical protein
LKIFCPLGLVKSAKPTSGSTGRSTTQVISGAALRPPRQESEFDGQSGPRPRRVASFTTRSRRAHRAQAMHMGQGSHGVERVQPRSEYELSLPHPAGSCASRGGRGDRVLAPPCSGRASIVRRPSWRRSQLRTAPDLASRALARSTLPGHASLSDRKPIREGFSSARRLREESESAIFSTSETQENISLVPSKGLEPPHRCRYMDLNHARLPIPPRWQSGLQCSGGPKAAVTGRTPLFYRHVRACQTNSRRVAAFLCVPASSGLEILISHTGRSSPA